MFLRSNPGYDQEEKLRLIRRNFRKGRVGSNNTSREDGLGVGAAKRNELAAWSDLWMAHS